MWGKNTVSSASASYDSAQISETKRRHIIESGGPNIMFPVVERPLAMVAKNGETKYYDVPSHKALARPGDNGPVVLGVVGSDYHVVQNDEFMGQVDKAVEELGLGEYVTSTKMSHGGAWTAKKYTFPGVTEFIPQKRYGDTDVNFAIEARNGFDGSTRIGYGCSSIDGFCDNTLVYVDRDFIERKHTSGFLMPTIERMAKEFQDGYDAFRMQCDIIRLWADKEITNDQARDLLVALPGMSKRRSLKFLARFETEVQDRGSTLWALASALTYFSSHNSEEFKVRGSGKADNEAKTLANRQAQVLVWLNTKAWKAAAGTLNN